MTTPNSLLPPPAPDAPATPAPVAAPLTPEQQLAGAYDVVDAPAALPEPKPAPGPVEPKPAPVAAAAAPAPAVVGPKHPKYLTTQATALGVPDSVIAAVSTDVLGDIVAQQTTLVLSERRTQGIAALRQGDTPPTNLVPGQAAAAAAPAPAAFDWGEVDDEIDGQRVRRKIAEDEIHPAIANVIKKQDERIKQLEGAIREAGQQAQAQQERSLEQRLDAAFSTMPRAFGTGPAAAVKGTPEFARRKAVWAMMNEMPAEVRQTMTLEAALAQCAEQIFGIKPGAAAAATPAKPKAPPAAVVVADWNDGAVARPTNRTPSPLPNGRAKAAASVADYLSDMKNGEGATDGDTTIDEFLP